MAQRLRTRSSEKLVRRNFSIFDGDYEQLQKLYPNVSISAVVRNLIRGLIKRNELLQHKNHQPINIEAPSHVIDDLLDASGTDQPLDGSEPEEP